MGLFSILGKTASMIAKGIDSVDSFKDAVDNLPEKLDKARDALSKTVGFAMDKIQLAEEKKKTDELMKKGIENESSIKILPDELFNVEQSVSVKYNDLEPLTDDFFIAKMDRKYGIIDIDDNVIIPFEYDHIKKTNNSTDLIAVKKNDKYGFINIKNEVIIDFDFYNVDVFSCGLAPANADILHWGYINNVGQFVVEPIYDRAEAFKSNGVAKISDKPTLEPSYRSNEGIIDCNGNVIVKPVFDSVSIYKNHIRATKFDPRTKNISDSYFDLSGNPIEEFYDDYIDNDNDYINTLSPADKIYVYNNSKVKYGWYEETSEGKICRIKPIYDSFLYTKYDRQNGGYSIVKCGGLYGIIRINK